MAESNDVVMTDVMNLLEAEPQKADYSLIQPGPDIPALREKLAILVSTAKCKETIGVQLTQDSVKRLDAEDVQK